MKRPKKQTRNDKRRRVYLSQKDASLKSKYGRKRRYLDRNGGFGFDYPDKPWKKKG